MYNKARTLFRNGEGLCASERKSTQYYHMRLGLMFLTALVQHNDQNGYYNREQRHCLVGWKQARRSRNGERMVVRHLQY